MDKIIRNTFLVHAALLPAPLPALHGAEQPAPAGKPNVLVILADDKY